MNVLFATSDNSLSSGAFNSCVFLAKETIKAGHNVLVVVPNPGDGEILLKENKIPYERIDSIDWVVHNEITDEEKAKKIQELKKVTPEAIKKFHKLIRKRKIDIVHINTSYHFVAAIAAIGTKAKVVWHLREFLEEDQNTHILKRPYALKLISHSDAIICISQALYNKYKGELPIKKMYVVHNGIDVKKYLTKNHKILNKRKAKLLCVGGVWEKKGQPELCEAVGLLKKKYKIDNVELDLVGECNDFNENVINDISKKYKLSSINLCGRQKDTPKYYKDADIVFMCSTSEAFGRVTVEGMLAGCLVIGKNCAGTSEIITDKITGILYENTETLAKCIKYALENKEDAREIAKAGQKYALENFTAELNCKNVLDVYKKVLKQRED